MSGLASVPARRWRVLAVLAAAQFMVTLDVTVVSVALPAIRADLGVDVTSLPWVVNAYTLAFGGLLLLGGRAADLLGRRRMVLIGLAVFGGASVLSGSAVTGELLVLARAAQGIGAALLSPAALSILSVVFPAGRERTTAVSVWGGLAGLGGTVGVVAGGLLVNSLSWRWVFLVNVPVALAAGVMTLRLVPPLRAPATAGRRGVDAPGALMVTGTLLLLVLAVSGGARRGWTSPVTGSLLAASAVLLLGLVVHERRAKDPLVPSALFRSRRLATATVGNVLAGGTWGATFFLTTLSLQDVLGLTPLQTGLAFVPMGVAVVTASALAARLVDRFGTRPVQASGALASAAGLALLAGLDPGGSFVADILPGTLLFGIGLPLVFVSTAVNAVADVPERHTGIAAGLGTTALQTGAALGVAVLAAVSSSGVTRSLAEGAGALDALAAGHGRAYAVAAAVAALGLLPALAVPRRTAGAPAPEPDVREPEPTRR